MKVIDLTKALKKYTSGWVAMNDKHEVVVHARSFADICRKVKNSKKLVLVPASKSYFGFVTAA